MGQRSCLTRACIRVHIPNHFQTDCGCVSTRGPCNLSTRGSGKVYASSPARGLLHDSYSFSSTQTSGPDRRGVRKIEPASDRGWRWPRVDPPETDGNLKYSAP